MFRHSGEIVHLMRALALPLQRMRPPAVANVLGGLVRAFLLASKTAWPSRREKGERVEDLGVPHARGESCSLDICSILAEIQQHLRGKHGIADELRDWSDLSTDPDTTDDDSTVHTDLTGYLLLSAKRIPGALDLLVW